MCDDVLIDGPLFYTLSLPVLLHAGFLFIILFLHIVNCVVVLGLVVNLVTSPIEHACIFSFIPQDIARIVFGFQLDGFVMVVVDVYYHYFADDHLNESKGFPYVCIDSFKWSFHESFFSLSKN